MMLPSTFGLAEETGLPVHSGRHESYNQSVLNQVNAISAYVHTRHATTAGPLAAGMMKLLQRDLRIKLAQPSLDGRPRMIDEIELRGMTDNDLAVAVARVLATWPSQH